MLKRWSKEDEEILIKNFNQVTNKELELLLNRRIKDIKSKMKRLYLNGALDNRFRQWSNFEDDFLYDNYGEISMNEIEMTLFRTPSAIYSRLYRIHGESKQNSFTGQFMTGDIMTILGCSKRYVYNLIERTSIPYIRTDNNYIFEQDDFWEWIRLHPKYIQAKTVNYDDLYFCPYWYKELVNKLKKELSNKVKTDKYSQQEIVLMKRLRKKGYTYSQIGEELNRHPSGIKNKFLSMKKEMLIS